MLTVPAPILNLPVVTFKKSTAPRDCGCNLAGQQFKRGAVLGDILTGFQIQEGP